MVRTRYIIPCSAFFFTVLVAAGIAASQEQERNYLGILQSDAPAADKAIACKQLAIYGSSESVPELAKLLPDPQLSSWARISLEAIPGPASDAALREAANALQGRLLIGVINSIGVRRDAEAVTILTARLGDPDPDVAAAAAVALGRIGNDAAATSLLARLQEGSPGVRSAIAEGCVLCAERRHLSGNSAGAIEIYDEVRTADVPLQRVLEATRGAILAREDRGIPLLIDTLRAPEKKLFQLALAAARELPGRQVDKALARELATAAPQRAALIVQAMADRPETVELAAILGAAEVGSRPDGKQVRLSAIEALRRVGDPSCLTTLLEVAAEEDADLRQAARDTLTQLPGADVDAQIVALLPQTKGRNYTLLLHLIGQRRIDAVSEVIKALEHADPAVRDAAFVALGETVSLQQLPLLVSAVVAPKQPGDAAVAQQALKAASVRMPDRDACARQLAEALDQATAGTKTTLLEILGDVGGNTAMQTVHSAATSSDPQMQDDGSRLLGKWNSVDVAPLLLDLANNAPADKYKVRALRGYIGVARKFPMPEPERVAMCQKAFEISRRLDDQKLILEVLQVHPSSDGLKLAIDMKRVPELKEEAPRAALAIAQELAGKEVDPKALLAAAGVEAVNLEIIRAEYGDDDIQQDVTALVRKHAHDSPWIMLSSTSYNASLGGDPAPGRVKQLKIRYRMNGKPAEASFAENSLIMLPLP